MGRTPFAFWLRAGSLRSLILEGYPFGWIVNVPFPEHPVPPIRVQLPDIVLPVTVPWRVRTLLVAPGNIVVMVISNVPVTLPLKLPIRPKLPVSDV